LTGGWEGGEAARIDADGGGAGGGGAGGTAGSEDSLGGGKAAGPARPRSVFLRARPSPCFAATCAPEPGGAGGAFGAWTELFFPRPSKISRSDPPPLFSSDIRVS